MGDQEHVSALLSNAYESLRNVDLDAACGFLDKALEIDFECPEVLYALKCARFWQDRAGRIAAVKDPFERGDFAVAQWKAFTAFLGRLSGEFEAAKYAFKRYLFALALESYLAVTDEEKTSREAEFSLRMGRCRKACGDYESAMRHLERAAKIKRDDPGIVAELADCHALSGEQRMSKALFREAFFLGADRIDLDLLECDMIRMLRDKVAELGYEGAALAEWMPIYGNLLGVFSVKRELKPSESTRLNSMIFQNENDLRENPKSNDILVPRLLNRYFWLVDHLVATDADRTKIDGVLLKIRLHDPVVYRQYTA
ncbi:MAG: hypothetical protein WBH97_01800 [Rectinemataceae bacterium]